MFTDFTEQASVVFYLFDYLETYGRWIIMLFNRHVAHEMLEFTLIFELVLLKMDSCFYLNVMYYICN